jgi:hypothetical protein
MCARFEINKKELRPGKSVAYWLEKNAAQLPWAGFAKRESIGWWKGKGGTVVDIPATRFAERSDKDGRLIWDDVPAGNVIRGLIDPNEGKPLLKVVTRASTEEELARFEHPRMPVIEAPLFSAEPTGLVSEQPWPQPPEPVKELPAARPVQGELL